MLALLAAALSLTLQNPVGFDPPQGFAQGTPAQSVPANAQPRSSGHYIEPQRQEGDQKVDVSKDALLPRRSTAWVVAGALGMSSIGAGIGGTFAQAIYKSTNQTGNYTDERPGNRGMVVGMLIGLLPGLLFGNEARNESNGLGRQVIVLLDLGGALAASVAAASIRAH